MGLFARLLGTDPAARLSKARRFLDGDQFNDARQELEGLDHPEAAPLLERARQGLVVLNLDEAGARFRSGDFGGGQEHLELAGRFGATADQLREVRRIAREERAKEKARQQAEAEAAMVPEGNDPLWALPPDDPRIRYALLLEGWPDGLRERLAKLGPEFAKAVMLIEEGQAAQSFELLGAYVGKDPVARLERSRAALQSGNLPAAASDLATFGDKVGHQRIGNRHTAVSLAQVLAQLGRLDEALAVVDAQLAAGDADLSLEGVRASLLEGLERLPEAEEAASALLRRAPKDQGLYRLLARIRLRRDNRGGASQALEACLARTCSNPGKCGNQPFDVTAGRMLATLYLEDRQQPKRVAELMTELSRAVQQPAWEDRYISALHARNEGLPGVDRLARHLLNELTPGDARAERVHRAFAPQLTG